ncbi:hypothetical protein KAR91_54140, partial [Candidatus Pacearchaeota archaeon]|nr:hypothetical protein [Candidatus Pacearchaeota archaeon]
IAEAAKIEAIERLTELKDQAVETEKADEERKAEDERLVAERDRLRLEGLEAGRISTIKDKIQAIKDRGAYDPEATAEQISGRIHVLENTYTTEDAFQEFQEEAIAAIKGALVALRAFYTMKVEQERVAAIKAEEEAAEATEAAEDIVEEAIEDSKNEEASKHLDNIETAPENQVDTVKTSEDIEFADRMAFVDALVKLFPGVPTPVANNIYYAIEDGKLPNVQLIGGE